MADDWSSIKPGCGRQQPSATCACPRCQTARNLSARQNGLPPGVSRTPSPTPAPKHPTLRRQLAWAFALYVIDMLVAIAGWVCGFGLEVKNWWALVGLCLALRFVFHVVQRGYLWGELQRQADEAADNREAAR